MQNVSNLQIPEGMVKTIHDKDSRLLWGAVGYDTKYAGDTFQQTYSGKNIYKGARAFTVYDKNGIKITNDGTGALTFNGKATGNIYVNIIDNTNATTQANSKTNVVSGETYIASVAAPFPNNVSFRTNNLNYSLMTISKGATSSSSWTASATENNGLWCYVYITNGKEFNNDVLKVQVEKGSIATSYEPYVGGIASPNPDYPQDIQVVTGEQTVSITDGTNTQNFTVGLGSIELAKIGDYQDYIYKSGDDWYVHKGCNKIIYDGSQDENWSYANGSVFPFRMTIADAAKLTTSQALPPNIFSNYYTPRKWNYDVQTESLPDACITSTVSATFAIRNVDIGSLANFKTWLSTHNTSVYYPLATPTDTKITDSTLIGQLNAVHQWLTRYGYNATVSGNLPLIIDRTNL